MGWMDWLAWLLLIACVVVILYGAWKAVTEP